MNNDLQTRAAVCGAGVLLAIIFLFTHLPLILLIIPVVIVLSSIIADKKEIHASLVQDAQHSRELRSRIPRSWTKRKQQLSTGTALLLVRRGRFRGSVGRNLRGPARDVPCREEREPVVVHYSSGDLPPALYLPALAHPKWNDDRHGHDHQAVRKEQAGEKVFRSVFIILAGFILAQVADQLTAQEILRIITGIGGG